VVCAVAVTESGMDAHTLAGGITHSDVLRRGLRAIIQEAGYAQLLITLTGGVFLTGLALHLGASDFDIGLLVALPFLAQAAQLFSPMLTGFLGGDKRASVIGFAVGRLIWLPLIPLLLVARPWRLHALFAVVLISSITTMVATPSWISWMAELVPRRFRGRFFGYRNAIIAASLLAATIAGSLFLDYARAAGFELLGFVLLIGAAVALGLQATRVMNKLPAPSIRRGAAPHDWHQFLAPFRAQAFRELLVVFFMWNVAIGTSAAFFAPHMLRNLKMSFFEIGVYSCLATVAAVMTNRPWGKIIDRFGSRAVLALCSAGIALVPLVWFFPRPDFLWILIPETIYSGVMWAGFNLAAFTIPLDRCPHSGRPTYLAVFAVVTGLAFFLGSLLSGVLAKGLEGMATSVGGQVIVNYHVLFAVSAVLRLMTAVLLISLRQPTEVRLPVVLQLMGYAVLKWMSIGRQIAPFTSNGKRDD